MQPTINNIPSRRGIISEQTQRKATKDLCPISLNLLGDNWLIRETSCPRQFGEGSIKDLNSDFIKVLSDLGNYVNEHGYDLKKCEHDYFDQLREVGVRAYNTILPPDTPERHALGDMERRLPGQRLSITITSLPIYPLFWEMIYADEAFEALDKERFWGFNYPLGRIYLGIASPPSVRLQSGAFAAIHDKLTDSRKEVHDLSRYLTMAARRLERNFTLQLLDSIVPPEAIRQEDILALFHDDDFRYGIVHFACHCERPSKAAETETYLSFTAHGLGIEMSLAKLITRLDKKFQYEPLVFLNACESGLSDHLLQTWSFPTGLLRFKAAGVIATACTIPDGFASAFAAEFYRRLLDETNDKSRRVDIGEILRQTRLYFAEEFNNPLGLAYGLHAASNQELHLLD